MYKYDIYVFRHYRTEEIGVFCMNIIEGPINTPLQKFKNFITEKKNEKYLKIIIVSHTEYLKKNEMKRLDFLFRVMEKSFEYGNIVVFILWDIDVYDFGIKINNGGFFDGDNDKYDNDMRDYSDIHDNKKRNDDDDHDNDKRDNDDNHDNEKRDDDDNHDDNNHNNNHDNDKYDNDKRDDDDGHENDESLISSHINDKFNNGDNDDGSDNDKRNDGNDHDSGNDLTNRYFSAEFANSKGHDLRALLGKEWSKVCISIYSYIRIYMCFICI
jgi:hypothetical protein